MKKIIYIFILVLAISPVFGAEIIEDPLGADSIIVGEAYAGQSEKTTIPINFFNDEELGGIEVVVTWDNPIITLDSFSFVGSRISNLIFRDYTIIGDTLIIYGFPASEPFISPGSGLLGNIYFSYTYDQNLGTIVIDSTTTEDGYIIHSNFFSNTSSQQFVPNFTKGALIFTDVTCCIGDRGNIDGSEIEMINISDLTYLINYFFLDGSAPACRYEANANGDPLEEVNIIDLTYIIDFLFRGGPPPKPCP
ncbi:MAG: hypothetical protein DRP35_02105 [Candidatus Zixiibacteriota bacterium]|nr:MAG: hypothetical protein DRP35_02105 [candidate division Zixibacteria bacterium]